MTAEERQLVEYRRNIANNNRRKIDGILERAMKLYTVEGAKNTGAGATAINYLDKLKNKIAALVVNSNYVWAYISAPRTVEATKEQKMEFERASTIIFDYIQSKSNFEAEKSNILSDFLISTACFKVSFTGDIMNPIRFDYANLKDVYLGNDRPGKVGDVFYKRKAYKADLVDIYGIKILDNEHVQAMTEETEKEVTEATIYDYNKKKYMNITYLDDSIDKVIFETELDYNPWIVARAEKMRDCPYGVGPGFKAIEEIEKIIKKMKNIEHIGAKLASPPMLFTGQDIAYMKRGKFNTPGSINYMGNNGQNILTPLNQGKDMSVEFYDLEDNKQILNDIFMIDVIGNIRNVDDLKNITATTTRAAINSLAERIEPMYSSLQKEMLEQIVKKCFKILIKANIIAIDEISFLKENEDVGIRFYNALTMAQEDDDAERANAFYADMQAKFGIEAAAMMINAETHIDRQRERYRAKLDEFKDGEETQQEMQNLQAAAQGQGDIT